MFTIHRRYLIITASATVLMLFGMHTSSATPIRSSDLGKGLVEQKICVDWSATKTATISIECSKASPFPPTSRGSSCRNSLGDPCGSTYERTLAGGKLNK